MEKMAALQPPFDLELLHQQLDLDYDVQRGKQATTSKLPPIHLELYKIHIKPIEVGKKKGKMASLQPPFDLELLHQQLDLDYDVQKGNQATLVALSARNSGNSGVFQ